MFLLPPPFCLFTGRASEAPNGPEKTAKAALRDGVMASMLRLVSIPPRKSLRGQIWGLREPFRPSGPVAASQVNRVSGSPSYARSSLPLRGLSFCSGFLKSWSGVVLVPSFAVTSLVKYRGSRLSGGAIAPRRGSTRRRSGATEDRGNRRFPAGDVSGRSDEVGASAHSFSCQQDD